MPNQAIEALRERIEDRTQARDLAAVREEASRRIARASACTDDEAEEAEETAAWHNFRGILHALGGDAVAAGADFWIAHAKRPHWASPLFNQGVLHRAAGDWSKAEEFFGKALSKAARHRGGKWVGRTHHEMSLCRAMQGHFAEGAVTDIQVNVPTQLAQPAVERLWARSWGGAVAKINSIPRYAKVCGFGDLVVFDYGVSYSTGDDGNLTGPPRPPQWVGVAQAAGYRTLEVTGPLVDVHQGCRISEEARGKAVPLEIWSFTMFGPDQELLEKAPLVAGVAVRPGRQEAEKAAAVLREISERLGIPLFFPKLMLEAGDELGAARHRRDARRLGGGQ